MNRISIATILLLALCAAPTLAHDGGPLPGDKDAAASSVVTGMNNVGLSMSSRGYLGNAFSTPTQPSCRYPLLSRVEHLYLGGLWVGGVDALGARHVSTTAYSSNNLTALEEVCEFVSDGVPVRDISNMQSRDNYHPDALAPSHIEMGYLDFDVFPQPGHTPLGLHVQVQALGWLDTRIDDAVVLRYVITGAGASDIRDVYVGLWMDTTVGNTDYTSPWGYTWNYYDDVNGAMRPADGAPAWLMFEHDDDGDDGLAPSWIATQWLGSDPAPEPGAGTPPVSYNQHGFRGEPDQDDTYLDDDLESVPGRYQVMSNGDFDVGETGEADFSIAYNWNGLLSVGPFPRLAAGESMTVTFAVVCGSDSTAMRANAAEIQQFYDNGFEVALGLEDDGSETPASAASALISASPNPFNPATEIVWEAQAGPARMTVHDLKGRVVAHLLEESVPAGPGRLNWDGRGDDGAVLPAGTYLVRWRQDDRSSQLRVTLLK